MRPLTLRRTATDTIETAIVSVTAVVTRPVRNDRVRNVTARRDPSSTAVFDQLVAELLHRLDRVGEHRQLFAEAPDMDVHGARAAGVLVAPHVGEEHVA